MSKTVKERLFESPGGEQGYVVRLVDLRIDISFDQLTQHERPQDIVGTDSPVVIHGISYGYVLKLNIYL